MSSLRAQIRDNVVERLKTSVTDVESRVFPSRPETFQTIEVPSICVYTRDDEVETTNSRPTVQSRRLSLAIEILVRGTEEIDKELDELTEKVEAELLAAAKQSKAGLYSSVELQSTHMGFLDQGRKPIGAARMVFKFNYEKTFT